MSVFDSFSNSALGITQGFFGDVSTYKQDSTEIEVKVVYSKVTVEFNGYLTEAISAEILECDLSVNPSKGDALINGSKQYKIDSSQLNNGVYTLILKE